MSLCAHGSDHVSFSAPLGLPGGDPCTALFIGMIPGMMLNSNGHYCNSMRIDERRLG